MCFSASRNVSECVCECVGRALQSKDCECVPVNKHDINTCVRVGGAGHWAMWSVSVCP